MAEHEHDPVDCALARRASRLTLGSLFALAVRRGPERVALEQGGRRLSFAQLDRRTNALCRWLTACGIGRGDRIAILSENRVEYVELLLAAAKLGAIAACQNWRLADQELRHCIGLVTPGLILASERYAETARRCGGGVPVRVFGADYEAAVAAAPAADVTRTAEPEDGVMILYTSGTTGVPKGALISHRAEIARAIVLASDLPTAPDEGYVAWSPLFHMAAADTALAALLQGSKVILLDGFDADRLAAIAGRERLGWLLLLPGMIGPFLDAARNGHVAPVGVRWAGAMADLVPREQIAEVTRLLHAPFLNTFGSTETGMPPASRGSIAVGVAPSDLAKRQSSLCEIQLVDPDDREVPDGEPGELAIRGPTLFSGYWMDAPANRRAFRGGRFHMGDVFTRNPDGTLAFIDRRKYLIKSGAESIYPAEIERVLLADPRVVDAVVVRKPDPKWGEVPVAFVVRNDTALDAAALAALCHGRIAGYKIPREFRFVGDAELPRSATGKIRRGELEARISDEA